MQTRKDDSAFPSSYDEPIDEDLYLKTSGLTKRELFAAVALHGLLQNPTVRWTVTGKLAVNVADDLIQNLNKPT
jgi:hypothetical protein